MSGPKPTKIKTSLAPSFSLFPNSEIEIVKIPEGEAPEWVRAEWVGLTLPLVVDGAYECEISGVLSGQRSRFALWILRLMRRQQIQTGYLVTALTAVERLEQKSPAAANWWRSNAPQLLDGERVLIFEDWVCQLRKMNPPEPANV